MKIFMKNTVIKRHGFSFIEILLVLLIIGLLSSLVAYNVLPSQDRAMVEKAKADISIIEGALEMYRLENSSYPSQEDGLKVLVVGKTDAYGSTQSSRSYIRRLSKDPWGNDYVYSIPGEYSVYDLFSYGADGKKGGEGLNQDIGNWVKEVD